MNLEIKGREMKGKEEGIKRVIRSALNMEVREEKDDEN